LPDLVMAFLIGTWQRAAFGQMKRKPYRYPDRNSVRVPGIPISSSRCIGRRYECAVKVGNKNIPVQGYTRTNGIVKFDRGILIQD
jgi:hypothetical protein